MVLYLVAWISLSYSFPLSLHLETHTAIASKKAEAERIVAESGGFFPSVSVIRDGKLKSKKLTLRVEE